MPLASLSCGSTCFACTSDSRRATAEATRLARSDARCTRFTGGGTRVRTWLATALDTRPPLTRKTSLPGVARADDADSRRADAARRARPEARRRREAAKRRLAARRAATALAIDDARNDAPCNDAPARDAVCDCSRAATALAMRLAWAEATRRRDAVKAGDAERWGELILRITGSSFFNLQLPFRWIPDALVRSHRCTALSRTRPVSHEITIGSRLSDFNRTRKSMTSCPAHARG